ncbi:uncharacterized protein BCR38DRAFT_477047 [Pseudomassariella vexata]|uniref:Uncharacterized protein n=1 Tax=Pseudomassariella vexata TaxID=1141098 RepID=A0A1Y2DM33_9PEZI|nr:uncharacterized protein BCR38DRAFT_477047 [Pseudomassariella vexata]ORY60214.1 hypothetical protein BCR38DRAFT_477047 [Pseudomassariella vexata]
MANGFDKLEKFFSVSRRREKTGQGAARKKVSVVSPTSSFPPAIEAHVFPSPSFMRPTSMSMEVRDPIVRNTSLFAFAEEKERSQSLSGMQNQLRRRSSAYMTRTDGEWRPRLYGSSPLSSVALDEEQGRQDCSSTPRLSPFRFPECALFRQDESHQRSSADVCPHEKSRVDNLPRIVEPAAKETKLLDWSPKHISLLFNPLELPSMTDTTASRPPDEADASVVLMPSPLLIRSVNSTPEIRHGKSRSIRNAHSRSSAGRPEPRFSLFPKQYTPTKNPIQIHSPPASDGEEEHSLTKRGRSRSTTTLAASSQYSSHYSPKPSPNLAPRSDPSATVVEPKSLRETWGNRLDDPKLERLDLKNIDKIPRSRMKRPPSILTLSVMTADIAKQNILQEPTFDDFYALSDEDISEIRPATPKPNLWAPPCPPPKDKPKPPPPRKLGAAVATPSMQTVAINPNSGDVTPPDTPTDARFLTLTPPATPSGALGAIMAAGIAKTYNFDLVYVISLWPSGQGNLLDPSRRPSARSSQRPTRSGGTMVAHPNSEFSGRLMAAFGLNEVPSPFRIPTTVQLRTLDTHEWREYGNPTAKPEEFSRGWTCSFHSDHVPMARNSLQASPDIVMNRGIVFAAYTKRNNEAAVKLKSRAEKDQFLDRLHLDAKTLVDALLDRNE